MQKSRSSSSAGIDFSSGPVWKIILEQAVPLTAAQLVQLTYNLVDRIFLGHLSSGGGMALVGVGLVFPVATLITAFTAFFGQGGVPSFSMERGGGDCGEAERTMGNSFTLLLSSSVLISLLCFVFRKPVLYAFGASAESYPFAEEYLNIYLLGTAFSMLSTGLNGYINAQGFPVFGMVTVLSGAAVNIALDPFFIFVLKMGVKGAAIATVISQAVSAAWVLCFLSGKKPSLRLRPKFFALKRRTAWNIIRLGFVNFVMQAGNFLVQVSCNSTLQAFGGDVYVAVMTIANSVRDVLTLPVNGVFGSAQPVISYNYGAGENRRVIDGIRFTTAAGVSWTLLAWIFTVLFPDAWIKIFSSDADVLLAGKRALRLYFSGFVFQAFQFAGQSVFQALGDARHAIFFSILRKIVIVVPLTLALPYAGLGTSGVFLAEPVSNVIGGLSCYVTMRLTAYRKLKKESLMRGENL